MSPEFLFWLLFFHFVAGLCLAAHNKEGAPGVLAWLIMGWVFGPLGVLLYIAVGRADPTFMYVQQLNTPPKDAPALPAILPPANTTRIIECPSCNLQMSIPPTFNKPRGKCVHCGAEIKLT